MSFLSSIFGGSKKAPSGPPAPTFQPDPLVNQSDTSMFNFGQNVLQGILPTQYQDLIETNSPEFQAMLKNSNAQIEGSGLATAAMQGNARGGAANAGITQAIASNTANLSYSDLLNTQLNQKAILGTGLNAIQAANTGALTNQGQTNSFAANIYGDLTQQYGAQLGYNAAMTKLSAGLGSSLIGGAGSLISKLPFFAAGGAGTAAGAAGGAGLAGDLGAMSSGVGAAAGGFDMTSLLPFLAAA